ncbi:restriction endonuclease [Mucilaginibacter lutimaris]|uniref:Restriction endonuclease n=1 Tax=Mucilaginibacter lutimaris TaxID=931629 RepID=A0ABW2ZB54_9SPHI
MFDRSRYYPPTKSIPPALYSGRDAEVEFLKNRIVSEGKKVGLITGGNRVGKTSLAMFIGDRLRKELGAITEYISLELTGRSFPKLKENCRFVIFDDLETGYYPDASSKIFAFIKENPGPQYLLIDQTGDAFLKQNIEYELKLEPIKTVDNLQILIHELQNRIPFIDTLHLVELTRGKPDIIKIILRYVENLREPYTLAEVEKFIFEKIAFAGIRDTAGQIILPENPIFQEIKNDIIIVNGNTLEKLKKNPELMHKLTPREFEEMTAELFEKQGYKVDLTQATRDGGKDLIVARRDDIGDFIYYVECKKYGPKNPIGVNLVRELLGTVHADKVTAGVMITSSYFSPDAIEFSKKEKHRLSLVDYVQLKEWLSKI